MTKSKFKVGDAVRFLGHFGAEGGELHGAEGVVVGHVGDYVSWEPDAPKLRPHKGKNSWWNSEDGQLEPIGYLYSVEW